MAALQPAKSVVLGKLPGKNFSYSKCLEGKLWQKTTDDITDYISQVVSGINNFPK